MLPEHIELRNTARGHGDKGLAFYSYEDTQGLGVLVDARRQTHRAPFVETWRYRWLPGVEAPHYAGLRTLANCLTETEVAAERAKWPQMKAPPRERTLANGQCWLHRDRPASHFGSVQTSWVTSDLQSAMLCGSCAVDAAADPLVIVRASEARRAWVASMLPIRERLLKP